MGDGNAAFRLASNLKTAWLGSTCQGYNQRWAVFQLLVFEIHISRLLSILSFVFDRADTKSNVICNKILKSGVILYIKYSKYSKDKSKSGSRVQSSDQS